MLLTSESYPIRGPFPAGFFCLDTGVPRHRNSVVRPYVRTSNVLCSMCQYIIKVVVRSAAEQKHRVQMLCVYYVLLMNILTKTMNTLSGA